MAQLFDVRDGAATVGSFLLVATLVGCTSRLEKQGAEGQRDAPTEVEIAKVAKQPGDDNGARKQLDASMLQKHTADARAPDKVAQQVTEFFRHRDQWLLDKTTGEMSASTTSTPIGDELNRLRAEVAKNNEALKSAEADVAENTELLKPIESRIFRNTLKNDKNLKRIIENDKARAQELKDAVAEAQARAKGLKEAVGKIEERIDELPPALTAEEKQTALAATDDYADRRKRARETVLIIRKNLNVMPPNAPLTTDRWAIGAVGLLPQWPLGLFANYSDPVKRQILQPAADGISRGIAPNRFALEELDRLPGGIKGARKKANVRVVQVADDRRLLCAWLDTDYLFMHEIGDTSGHVDDEVLRIEGLAVVFDTTSYTSVSGAVRTVFVLRMVTPDQLPPMADN